MTLIEAIATARRIASVSAPVAEASEFYAEDGTTLCFRVLFWNSEAEAENDDGAKAVRSVTFAECDPENTATIR